MKLIKVVLIVSLFALQSFSRNGDGGDVKGNGGGGLKREGQYITFGTANIKVTIKPKESIDGMELLEKLFLEIDLDSNYKGSLIQNTLPSATRKYFDIKSEDLSERQKEILVSTYRKVTGITNENITIYAVTDPESKETYILPEFYELKAPEEKAAILFHESAWLINKDLTYTQVVDLEIQFQYYLEKNQNKVFGYDREFYSIMGQLFSNNRIPIYAAFKDDYQKGKFRKFITKGGGIASATLFGNEDYQSDRWMRIDKDNLEKAEYNLVLLKNHLFKMNKENPEMESFQVMLDNLKGILYSRGQFECNCSENIGGYYVEGKFKPWELNAYIERIQISKGEYRSQNVGRDSRNRNIYKDFPVYDYFLLF